MIDGFGAGFGSGASGLNDGLDKECGCKGESQKIPWFEPGPQEAQIPWLPLRQGQQGFRDGVGKKSRVLCWAFRLDLPRSPPNGDFR